MKFIADCMLGKLSRWMRILGFDVLYMKEDDETILENAERERRIILTKDTRMGNKKFKGKIYFVQNEGWKEQLREVIDRFSLSKKIRPFTRCPYCNIPLKTVKKERVKYLVPSFIYNQKNDFSFCKKCEKVFWEGTHLEDMEKKVNSILKLRD